MSTTSRGFFYYVNFNKLSTKKNEDKINLNTIKTNFFKDRNKKNFTVFDTVILDEKIYVYYLKDTKNCKTVNIDVAQLNLEYLDFEIPKFLWKI